MSEPAQPVFTLTPVDDASTFAFPGGKNAFAEDEAPPAIILEESLLSSPHSVDLDRTPLRDYIERFTGREPHVAELFHENTKITPHSGVNTALDEEQCAAAQRWYVKTAYAPYADDIDAPAAAAAGMTMPLADVGGAAARWLAHLQRPPLVELAYALHFMLVRPEAVHRVTPDGRTLWLDHFLDADRYADLCATLLGPLAGARAEAHLVMALAPWRYMVFQGPRGYRRAAADAGRMLGALEAAAADEGVATITTLDFHDARLDRALNIDGVDRSAFAVLACVGDAEGDHDDPGGRNGRHR
jgi:hypothetical protein